MPLVRLLLSRLIFVINSFLETGTLVLFWLAVAAVVLSSVVASTPAATTVVLLVFFLLWLILQPSLSVTFRLIHLFVSVWLLADLLTLSYNHPGNVVVVDFLLRVATVRFVLTPAILLMEGGFDKIFPGGEVDLEGRRFVSHLRQTYY